MKTREIPDLNLSDISRFKSKIQVAASGCWLWMARLLPNGYGQFVICKEKKEHFFAHRVAFFIWKGAVKGLVIRHKCDNPRCVNPEHLTPGTQVDNYQDSVSRGRSAQQSNRESLRTRCKLTWEMVQEIRASKDTRKTLAARYGVSDSTIKSVRLGKSWRE